MWISKLVIDLIDCTITLQGTRDPERDDSSLQLKFCEVSNVQVERYHDLHPRPCLGDFNYIRVEDLGHGRSRFRTDTGDAMLAFEAASEPSLTILDGHQITRTDIFVDNDAPAA